MRPELPFLAAGGVALVGGARKARGFPPNALGGVIATVILVIVASATSGTRAAPLVHAVGLLLLLTVVMATVTATTKKGAK